jgi:hypothetical protein
MNPAGADDRVKPIVEVTSDRWRAALSEIRKYGQLILGVWQVDW